jgi:hypothetical protein
VTVTECSDLRRRLKRIAAECEEMARDLAPEQAGSALSLRVGTLAAHVAYLAIIVELHFRTGEV